MTHACTLRHTNAHTHTQARNRHCQAGNLVTNLFLFRGKWGEKNVYFHIGLQQSSNGKNRMADLQYIQVVASCEPVRSPIFATVALQTTLLYNELGN